MIDWMKLIDCKDVYVRRGSTLRVRRSEKKEQDWYPDAYTDFIVFDPLKTGTYGLMVASGQKAGMIYVVFPLESSGGDGVGLKIDWLRDNWREWVYPDGVLSEAWIRDPRVIDSFDAE